MKRFKESLFFIVPIIVLFFLPVLYFIFAPNVLNYPAFIGNANYLKLLLEDKFFYKAIFNTFCMPVVISFLILLLFAVFRYIKKPKFFEMFLMKYLLNVSVPTLITFIILIILKHPFLQSLLNSLRVAIIIALIFWIIDIIFYSLIKKAYD